MGTRGIRLIQIHVTVVNDLFQCGRLGAKLLLLLDYHLLVTDSISIKGRLHQFTGFRRCLPEGQSGFEHRHIPALSKVLTRRLIEPFAVSIFDKIVKPKFLVVSSYVLDLLSCIAAAKVIKHIKISPTHQMHKYKLGCQFPWVKLARSSFYVFVTK